MSDPGQVVGDPLVGAEAAIGDVAQALREGLVQGKHAAIARWLEAALAVDAADVLARLDAGQVARVLALASDEERARIFGYLPGAIQVDTAAAMEREVAAALIERMSHDERADLVKALPEDVRERLLPALARAEREDARRLASYAEGTAGALMTSDYVTLQRPMRVPEAIAHLRRVAPDSETIYNAYVLDAERRLLGVITLRHLITASDEATVGELMQENVVRARVDEDQEDVARAIARYDFIALPIVDAQERLVGIVTADDALDVVEAEATEDMLLGATVGRIGESVGAVGTFKLFRKRVGWLLLLVLASLLTGASIDAFRDTISRNMGLLFFLPLLIATSGNAGAQAATLMVRALATGEVVAADFGRMLARETVVAAALGVTLAAAMMAIGLVYGGLAIAVLVAVTMAAVVLFGSLVGLCLPFALSHLRLDPATASAPLVTSISDVGGVLIYFGFAVLLLPRFA
ncbi:MAG TPA: magnesium transporter [Xanthomonadaceae bacterium]|nr:magnesium transporter [Xanthomonadaceae bacterium]